MVHSYRRSVLAGLILLLAVPVTLQAKDSWTSVRTKNFLLVGNAGEKEIRKVATRLEQFRDVFARLFPSARFETPVPTTVIVFKSMSSYKPFNSGNNAGYFQKGEDVNYITLTTELSAQNPYSVIYHEYVHLLVNNTAGNAPTWFNEGLAEYYSSFDIEEDRKAHLGDLIPYHLETLRDEKLLPLRTLFAVDQYSPYYNESGAVDLAQIYLRQEKFDLARQTLEPLRNAKDRQVHMQAESLLNSIKNYEEQVARYKADVAAANATGQPRLQPREESSTTTIREDAPPREMSPSDYLQQALRPVEAGEQRIQGLFIKLDCDNKGVAYFIVQTAERMYKVRATALDRVQLVAYTQDAGAEVSCGPRKTQNNVLLTFRPSSDPKDVKARIDGDAIAVELVPKDFQLKK